MYLYVVTKIFTWFIGWNGMRLRMNEERMVEGALQLALYAFRSKKIHKQFYNEDNLK